MVRVGDRVIYGAGLSKTGAARPYYHGHEAVILEVNLRNGCCTVEFEDGTKHICPTPWVRKVDRTRSE